MPQPIGNTLAMRFLLVAAGALFFTVAPAYEGKTLTLNGTLKVAGDSHTYKLRRSGEGEPLWLPERALRARQNP